MSLARELAVVATPRLERLILWQTIPGYPCDFFVTKLKIRNAPDLRVLGYLDPSIHVLEIGNTVIQVSGLVHLLCCFYSFHQTRYVSHLIVHAKH
jgi:hypothetical protein